MYALHLSYDTSKPAHHRYAYKVSIVLTDDERHELRQIGPVHNNIVHYHGVFRTHAEAWEAYDEYRKA